MLKKEFQDGSSTLLYGSWGERVEVGNTYAFSQLKVICSVIVSFSVPSFCFKCLPIIYCRKMSAFHGSASSTLPMDGLKVANCFADIKRRGWAAGQISQ